MKSYQLISRILCAVCVLAGVAALGACSGKHSESRQTAVSASSTRKVAVTTAKFAPFTGNVPQALTSTQCSLDLINDKPSASAAPVASGSTVIFGGWAGNGHGLAAKQFDLVLKGTHQSYAAPLTTGVERVDVAKAWNSKAMAKSGYNIAANLSDVTAGAYGLYIVNPADSTQDCDLHWTLTVE